MLKEINLNWPHSFSFLTRKICGNVVVVVKKNTHLTPWYLRFLQIPVRKHKIIKWATFLRKFSFIIKKFYDSWIENKYNRDNFCNSSLKNLNISRLWDVFKVLILSIYVYFFGLKNISAVHHTRLAMILNGMMKFIIFQGYIYVNSHEIILFWDVFVIWKVF